MSSDHSEHSIQQLPEAALIQILQLVPQQQRLSCAALVNKSWAAAAAAATTDIVVAATRQGAQDPTPQPVDMDSLQVWLNKYAEQITSLTVEDVKGSNIKPLQRPLARLQRLESLSVRNCCLQFAWQPSRDGSSTFDQVAAIQHVASIETVPFQALRSVKLEFVALHPITFFALQQAQLACLELVSTPHHAYAKDDPLGFRQMTVTCGAFLSNCNA